MKGPSAGAVAGPGPRLTVLHCGCGPARRERMPHGFQGPEWRELRYDIDPSVAPDIVGSIIDMRAVATGSIDALFNSHVIEHLYPHEVPVALGEFHRALKLDGFVVLGCPDLQSVAEQVATGRLMEPAVLSPSGPISAIDMLYGYRPALAAGNLFMAHRTGFTAGSIGEYFGAAGFVRALTVRSATYDLWALTTKHEATDEELYRLANAYLPRVAPWTGPPPV